jgi:hypothetical protein
VADRDGYGVALIRGPTDLGFQEERHHLTHLLLVGRAVTRDRLLDRSRRILIGLQLVLCRCENQDPSGVPELECRAGVLGVKDRLDRHCIGLGSREHSGEALVQLPEADGEGSTALGADNSAVDQSEGVAGLTHQPPAADGAARVDTED